MMKRLLIVLLALVLLPGGYVWAVYGKSNVVEKQLRHSAPEPAPQMQTAQPVQEPAPQLPPASGAEPLDAPVLPRQVCEKKIDYPYTIHILSSQDIASARTEMKQLRKKLSAVFISKTDLGASGIWYRVDYGVFTSAKEAVLRMRELQEEGVIDKGAFIGGPVHYTIELGIYAAGERDDLDIQSELLSKIGISTYMLEESGGCLRLVTGAFPQVRSAKMALGDLEKQGIKGKITKR